MEGERGARGGDRERDKRGAGRKRGVRDSGRGNEGEREAADGRGGRRGGERGGQGGRGGGGGEEDERDGGREEGKEKLDKKESLTGVLDCPVCLESYSEGERRPLMLPACGHTFCKLCLATLLARNSEEGKIINTLS